MKIEIYMKIWKFLILFFSCIRLNCIDDQYTSHEDWVITSYNKFRRLTQSDDNLTQQDTILNSNFIDLGIDKFDEFLQKEKIEFDVLKVFFLVESAQNNLSDPSNNKKFSGRKTQSNPDYNLNYIHAKRKMLRQARNMSDQEIALLPMQEQKKWLDLKEKDLRERDVKKAYNKYYTKYHTKNLKKFLKK